jgi:APA family basic amino acid/polyamine antiporter
MAFSAATIFILRKRTADLDQTKIYTMKLYPLLPLIFIAAYIFVAISIMIDKPNTALTAIGVLAAFMVIYFVARKISSSNEAAS